MSKSPSLRRIQADIRELSIDPSDRYHAAPLENDMFEWHFTIRGADGTDFEGGYYHGRILLPAEYPFKPPNIVFLTPSGRFETNVKVCLSFSAYHPELWQPAWGIRLILEALVSFLPTKADGAIGALDWTSEERKRLAKKSSGYVCQVCGNCAENMKLIEKRVARKRERSLKNNGGKDSGGKTSIHFQKEIEQLHVLQLATEGINNDDKSNGKNNSNLDDDDYDDDGDKASNQDEIPRTENIDSSPVPKLNKKDNKSSPDEVKSQNEDESNSNSTSFLEPTTFFYHHPLENEENSKGDESDQDGLKKLQSPSLKEPIKPFSSSSCIKESYEENQADEASLSLLQDDTNQTTTNSIVSKTGENQKNNSMIGDSQDMTSDSNNVTPPSAESQTNTNTSPTDERLDSPLLSDPVVHTGIVIFAMIIYLLLRRIHAVVEDMRKLEEQFHL